MSSDDGQHHVYLTWGEITAILGHPHSGHGGDHECTWPHKCDLD